MKESLHLALGSEALDRLALKSRALVRNLADHRRRQNKEATVNPATFTLRLFLKPRDAGPVKAQSAETGSRSNGGNGGLFAVVFVEGDFSCDVDVANTVSVRHTEGFFTFEVSRDIAESPAGRSSLARIDKGHSPGFRYALMNLHPVFGHIEGHVRHVQEVVSEIFLDEIALVTAADDEVVDLVVRVDLQDVPEDRPASDFDHRLGADSGFFAEPGAETTGEDNCFHFIPLLPVKNERTAARIQLGTLVAFLE